MKSKTSRLLSLLGMAIVSMLAMLLAPSGAQAANTQCFPYTKSGSPYPANGVNAFYCGQTAGTVPIQSRRDTLYNGLVTAIASKPNVLAKLSNQGVKYYFFNNRDEANNYFATTAPYNAHSGYQTNSARCANTFFHGSVGTIAVAIYDTCTFSNGSMVTNPSLVRVAVHETGHAFAINFGTAPGLYDASATGGFASFHGTDKSKMTPSNWSSYTSDQKRKYICDMFGSNPNSSLEIDLGSNPTYPGAVCTNGFVNYPWISAGGVYDTPATIAGADGKVPLYFTGTSNGRKETWAEAFTIYLLGNISQLTLLPVTDLAYGYDTAATVGGVKPPRTMNCTRFVVETYVNTLAKPTQAALLAVGCQDRTDL